MIRMRSARTVAVAACVAIGLTLAVPVSAQGLDNHECYSAYNDRSIMACTELLETPGLSAEAQSAALAMRALSHSLKGAYDRAIQDYDRAIVLMPDFAVALNNRAWAYFKSGRPALGVEDIERSLALDSTSPHSYDTRAHIRQWSGQAAGAMADYERAMFFGGIRMVKLYQCGLAAAGLYKGKPDGQTSSELRQAFLLCVQGTTCDPLPADEECRPASS